MRCYLNWTGALAIVLLGFAAALRATDEPKAGAWPSPPAPKAIVHEVRQDLQPLIDQHLADQQAKTLQKLAEGKNAPGLFKHPARVKSMSDPWGALADLENHGLRVAELARGGLAQLPALVRELLAKPPGKREAPPPSDPAIDLAKAGLREHVTYLQARLAKAEEHRDLAVKKLTPADQKFTHAWAPKLLATFGPQASLDAQTKPGLQSDRSFCTFAHDQIDWPEMLRAFGQLAAITDPAYLAALRKVLEGTQPIQDSVPGVTGDILYRAETAEGLFIIGGKGPNTYELKSAVALLIDLGGDDHYHGVIASSFDADHALSLVIDFDGDDTYEPGELGLATGRLGIGLLVDLAGKDSYTLKTGCGGVGLGGIGILCDVAGNDTYSGARYTQGVGFGGLGLLIEFAGDDTYTSLGYAMGFGGPAGVGAVIDVAGNDSYLCGKPLPGVPNQAELRLDDWGLGMGLGRRIWPSSPEGNTYALAGGVGMVLDLAGNDRYESLNCSQGSGYFFGIGVKLDLAGDDIHLGARYSHGAGAHFGMGIFVDYDGHDRYETTGPKYNGGCAWDLSVALCVDAAGDDSYAFERSSGLGLSDYTSWSAFADLGGKDRYATGHGAGQAARDGLTVFFDKAGEDDYTKVLWQHILPAGYAANGRVSKNGAGGLFGDR